MSLQYCTDKELPIYPISELVEIFQADGSLYKYLGWTVVTIELPDLPGSKMDIPILVVPTTNYHSSVPITLGTLTIGHLIDANILQNNIDLPNSWKQAYHSVILHRELGKTPDQPLGKVKSSKTVVIPPLTNDYPVSFVHKVKGYGLDINSYVEPRLGNLKQGLHIKPGTLTLSVKNSKITVAVSNNTPNPIEIPRGTTVGDVYICNIVPEIVGPDMVFGSTENKMDTNQTQVKQMAADQTNPLLDGMNKMKPTRISPPGAAQLNPGTIAPNSDFGTANAFKSFTNSNGLDGSPVQNLSGTKCERNVSSLPKDVTFLQTSVKGCVDSKESDLTGTSNHRIKMKQNGIEDHNKNNKVSSQGQNKLNKEPLVNTKEVDSQVSGLPRPVDLSTNKESTQTSHSVDHGIESNNKEVDDGSWVLNKLDLSGMEEWPPHLQVMAKALLCEYSDIFSKDDLDLGRTNLAKHDIQLTDYTPFKQSYRRIPPQLYDQVKAHLNEMLELGAIRPSQSPWSSAIVLVQKKDGTLRFCIDLRELNNRTIKDNYSLPRIEHHLEQLRGASWFTTLDLKSGYWQVELTEEAKPLTAFTVGPLGFYECVTMPFGASNAPATFQRLMENCLSDLNLKWCVVYLDDIIIYSHTPEDHLERLRAVFQRLRKAGLKLKPSKCTFFQQEIKYLGHIVSKYGIATDPSKIEKVINWPQPVTVNDVRSFLGFVGYYRKYIKGFSNIAKPLTELLTGLETSSKHKAKKLKVQWGAAQQQAFDQLKQACTAAPVLGYPNFQKPFILHTDSSLEGLGAVLYQRDESDQLRVIAYASRSLTKPERNYPAHKLEFLALKWAVTDKFKEYLYGAPFEVYTDNNPLTYVLSTAKLDATTQRWVAALASYDMDIYYRSGKHNIDADSLSRIKWPESINDVLANRQICVQIPNKIVQAICLGVKIPYSFSEILCLQGTIVPTEYDTAQCGMSHTDWVTKQNKDPTLHYIIEGIKAGTLNKKSRKEHLELLGPEAQGHLKYLPQYLVKNDLLYRKTYSNKGKKSHLLQLVLPFDLEEDALTGCHDEVGHLGRDKSIQLLRERFFWPGMYQCMSDHISSCKKCLVRKGTSPKAPMVPITATKPLELVHLDYLKVEPSKGNIENILVITDHYTRFAQAYPSKSQTAQATAKLLWDHFIVHYGFPEKFMSDQGKNFVSELIQDLCKIANVKKIRTTPYHPQSNGQCEKFNSTLCNMLGTMDLEDKKDWKSHISSMTHAYNSTKNASTGYSPYYLMFGREPRLPIDVKLGLFRTLSTSTFSKSKYIDRLKRRLDYAYSKASEAQAKSSQRSKSHYDQSHRAKNIKLEIGDLVLVRIVAFKARHKIHNRWEDEEYVIISQPDPTIPVYTVRPVTGGKERTLHRNLLLPLGTKASASDLQSDDSDEEDFEIITPQSGHQTGRDQIVKEAKESSTPLMQQDTPDVTVKELEPEKGSSVPCDITRDSLDDFDLSNLFQEEAEAIKGDSGLCQESTTLDDSEQTQTTHLSDSTGDSVFQKEQQSSEDSSMERLCKFFEKLPPPSAAESSANMDQFLKTLDSKEPEAKAKSVPVSESESEDEKETAQPEAQTTRRVSSRKNKGAPPTRYGDFVTHQLTSSDKGNSTKTGPWAEGGSSTSPVEISTTDPSLQGLTAVRNKINDYLHKIYFGNKSYD